MFESSKYWSSRSNSSSQSLAWFKLKQDIIQITMFSTCDHLVKTWLSRLNEWMNKQVTNVFLCISRFPFDCKNLAGYLVAVLLEYLFTVYEFVYVGSFTIYGFGFFIFFFAACRDIIRNLELINKHAKSKKRRPKIFKQLVTFFRYYSDVKELSLISSCGFSLVFNWLFIFRFQADFFMVFQKYISQYLWFCSHRASSWYARACSFFRSK